MIEKKLEIILITYNRSKYLENTLSQLIKSPFAKCKMTILDNCSTDNTPEICKKYQKLFYNMEIIRHKCNIGGNANILRAVETSNSLYTWILCDDDDYDFTDCDDVFEAIDSEEFDIILLDSSNFNDIHEKTINELLKEKNLKLKDRNNKYNYHECYKTSGRELFDLIGRYYFLIPAFLPATIFKTGLYDSNCFIEGYDNIHNLFPHYALISKSLEKDVPIYKSKKEIVTRLTTYPSDNYLKTFNGWFESSLMIKNQSDRKIVTKKMWNASFSKALIYNILGGKSEAEEEEFKKELIRLIGTLIKIKGLFRGIVYSLLALIVSIIPKRFCKGLMVKMENIRDTLNKKK